MRGAVISNVTTHLHRAKFKLCYTQTMQKIKFDALEVI